MKDGIENKSDRQAFLEERFGEIEARQKELEGQLLEQEHRFFSVWYNFFKSFFGKDKKNRGHTLKAVIYSLAPGRVFVFVAGGAFVGFVTIVLMHKNNNLLASQNYYLKEQIYVQAYSDRKSLIADIKKTLYEGDVTSEEYVPQFSRDTRQEALVSYLDISRTPLVKPKIDGQEAFYLVFQDFFDSMFGAAEGAVPQSVSQSNDCVSENRGEKIEFGVAFLSEIRVSPLCLSNVIFNGTYMEEMLIARSSMHHSRLYSASLKGTKLSNVKAVSLEVYDSDISSVFISGSDIPNLYLSESFGSELKIMSSDISNSRISDSDLEHSYLEYSDLSDSTIGEVNLRNSTLKNNSFSGANFRSVSLEGANLFGSNFFGASFEDVDFSGASFEGASLHNASFKSVSGVTCSQLFEAKYWQTARFENEGFLEKCLEEPNVPELMVPPISPDREIPSDAKNPIAPEFPSFLIVE